jgi:hypothetical protein
MSFVQCLTHDCSSTSSWNQCHLENFEQQFVCQTNINFHHHETSLFFTKGKLHKLTLQIYNSHKDPSLQRSITTFAQ